MQPDAAARTECQSRLDEDAERRERPDADAGARHFRRRIESPAVAELAVELEAVAMMAAPLLELRAPAKARTLLQ
jgi:hypothetical protein